MTDCAYKQKRSSLKTIGVPGTFPGGWGVTIQNSWKRSEDAASVLQYLMTSGNIMGTARAKYPSAWRLVL